MPSPPSERPISAAERALGEWLARGPGKESFDALLRAHPEHSVEIRQLHQMWVRLEPIARLVSPPPGASFTQRLEAIHGPGVDPQVSLDEPRAGESRGTNEFLRRLGTKARRLRYRLEGEIARGGMGAILRIWDEDIRRHIAMKVLLAQTGEATPMNSVDSRLMARFLEEAQVTGQLDHPGIVPVHELGLDQDGRVFFTMKLVNGRDLLAIQELVFKGREGWNETRALSVMLKVCEAVAYAHNKGVIHRDLKPANVMVGDFGEVYVMDWGLARVTGRADSRDVRIADDTAPNSVLTARREDREESPDSPIVTMEGDVIGTPAYMPPEQARGQVEKLTARSDVYAIGAMLYHLLARQMPYCPPDSRFSARTVLGMVIAGPPESLHALRKDVPAELVAICEKAMARDPAERYADTLKLGEDLRAFLEHRVVRAHQTGALAEFRKWVSRNRGTAAALAGLVLAVIGGVLITSALIVRADRRELLLADARLAANLVSSADTLWPTSPASFDRLKAWLADADSFERRRPEHAEFLAKLERDEASSSRTNEMRELMQETTPAVEKARASVARRLDQAQSIADRTLVLPAARSRWKAAIDDITARPIYRGLSIVPQFGLLPLGADPKSGLWEFWHVASGTEPERDSSTGLWQITGETGIVLVLLPGGNCSIGSRAMRAPKDAPRVSLPDELFAVMRDSPDWGGAWYDPAHQKDESFLESIDLTPFFISKYEMSLGQWSRSMGSIPVEMSGLTIDYPIAVIDWFQASDAMTRAGLMLPTEAQWEYACRGGTSSPFWTGWDIASLQGAANISDESHLEREPDSAYTPGFDDGIAGLAPIFELAPNPFGLHNVHGNVWEWCRDGYLIDRRLRASDGLAIDAENNTTRTIRGGSWFGEAHNARSANRYDFYRPGNTDKDLGVRPARELER